MAKIVEMKILDLRDVECRGGKLDGCCSHREACRFGCEARKYMVTNENHQPKFK